MKIKTVGELRRFLEEHRNSLPDDAILGLTPEMNDKQIGVVAGFDV